MRFPSHSRSAYIGVVAAAVVTALTIASTVAAGVPSHLRSYFISPGAIGPAYSLDIIKPIANGNRQLLWSYKCQEGVAAIESLNGPGAFGPTIQVAFMRNTRAAHKEFVCTVHDPASITVGGHKLYRTKKRFGNESVGGASVNHKSTAIFRVGRFVVLITGEAADSPLMPRMLKAEAALLARHR